METLPDTLITTYLEMLNPAEFRPAYLEDNVGIQIIRMGSPDIEFYRFLYRCVGEMWRWRDRLLLSDTELASVLDPLVTTVEVLYIRGVPAGYIELAKQGKSTEIAYFGLRSGYLGKGLGKHLLSYGVAKAWEAEAKRVWMHTCNLDGPYALKNYQKRGFQIYRMEEKPMPQRYS